MNTQPESIDTDIKLKVRKGILVRIGTVGTFLVLIGGILFLAPGRLNWAWAWVYLGICLASMWIHGSIMLHTNPEAIAERG